MRKKNFDLGIRFWILKYDLHIANCIITATAIDGHKYDIWLSEQGEVICRRHDIKDGKIWLVSLLIEKEYQK